MESCTSWTSSLELLVCTAWTFTEAKAAKLLSGQIKWVNSKLVSSSELAKGLRGWGCRILLEPEGFKNTPWFEKPVLSCLHCCTKQLRQHWFLSFKQTSKKSSSGILYNSRINSGENASRVVLYI